jgi:hypothetical protein
MRKTTFLVAAGLCAAALPALAAPPTNPGPMSISVSPTHIPVGASATVTATLTGAAGVSCGDTAVQYEIWTDASKTVLATNWTNLADGAPSNSVFSTSFDTGQITVTAGEVVTFRAKFDPGVNGGAGACGGGTYNGLGYGESPTVDLLIDTSAALCPNNQTTGVFIAIEQPGGPGTVAPGTTGTWTFNVTVTACEDVFDVTAQGGDNGWAPAQTCLADTGTCSLQRANKNNNVWLWIIGTMAQGQKATATLNPTAGIKNNVGQCGQVKLLNGAWSALYAGSEGGPLTKSAYSTYTATITVAGGICGP